MKTISLKLSQRLARLLAKHSKELGRSQSDLVRAALEEQFNGQAGASCHDLMQEFCGTLEGPYDLSANPKHLAGFGK